jgi:hypothetical protein
MPRPFIRGVIAAAFLAVLAAPAPTQTQLASLELEGPFGGVGTRVGLAGDLDGDGHTEVMAAGPTAVVTYDGMTGAKLSWIDLDEVLPLNIAGIDDVDGDGLRDIVVADGVSARVHSRADGAVLWTHPGSLGGSIGWDMAVVPDLDGDGIADVFVGEPDADPNGSSSGTVHVLSGADGAVINLIHGQVSQEKVGRSMDATADIDGDGKHDVIIGHSAFQSRGDTVGRVRVVNSLTGVDILVVENTIPTFSFAREVAGVGDVNGDSVPDIGVASIVSVNRVQVFDGATGAELWGVDTGGSFKLLATGDANGDGVTEIAVSNPSFYIFPSSVQILAGSNGSILWSWAIAPDAMVSAAAPGDLDGDLHPELLIGASANGQTGATAFALSMTVATGTLVDLYTNPQGGSLLGRHLDLAGDVNGDGTDDFVLASNEGVSVFDGVTGDHLQSIESNEAPPGIFSLGVADVAGPGDVNGDGALDFALGNPSSGGTFFDFDGRVALLSGLDGASLGILDGSTGAELGVAMEAVADRNGDGIEDLFVTAPGTVLGGNTDAGQVLILSGADLSLLGTLDGAGQLDGRFGVSLSCDADLNGDGVPELAVGSHEDSLGSFNAGRVVVHDGATHAVMYTFDGHLDGDYVKGELVGDGDGDGVPDVLTAEPAYLVPGEGTTRGRVRLWSGATGALLWSVNGPSAAGQFGLAFGATGDVNGDGHQDVAAMEGAGGASLLQVLSGLDGSLIDSFDPLDEPGSFAYAGSIRPAGHFDAGASADFLVGLPQLGGNGGARVYASSQGGIHGFVDEGFGKAGSAGTTPTLSMTGDLAPGGTVTVAARGALPGAIGAWFIGLEAAYVPFKKGVLVPSPFGPFFVIDLVMDGNGEFVLPVANPAVPPGLTLWSQFWFADAAAQAKVSATNGVMEIFQ